VDDRIREKIAKLVELAKRPGTPGEGNTARLLAIRLSLKYGIPCEFTAKAQRPSSTRPTASAPTQNSAHENSTSHDAIFYQWIQALKNLGWGIHSTVDTKIGRQIRFRKPGYSSEIRVTQRKSGNDFEAEHIMRPDPDKYGQDWSYMSYMTINLKDLLRHLSYSADTRHQWQTQM
jgi:hypothetical protein